MELTNKYKLLGFFWSQSFELRILILFDFEGHDCQKATVSAQIRGRRLIKKLGFFGEILLNKTLSN